MEISIRDIGSSKGIILPKAMLAQAGLDAGGFANVTVEDGAIVLRKPARSVREGWAKAAQALAAQGADALVLGEFSNADDAELTW